MNGTSINGDVAVSERGARWQEAGIITPHEGVSVGGSAGPIVEVVPKYLHTRLILKLTAPGRWILRPYVVTGPMLGIKVTCRYGVPGLTSGSCTDRGLQTTGVEAAVAAGGGVEAGVGSLRFLVEARYVRGLTRIETQYEYAWSHRSFGLTAGLAWSWR